MEHTAFKNSIHVNHSPLITWFINLFHPTKYCLWPCEPSLPLRTDMHVLWNLLQSPQTIVKRTVLYRTWPDLKTVISLSFKYARENLHALPFSVLTLVPGFSYPSYPSPYYRRVQTWIKQEISKRLYTKKGYDHSMALMPIWGSRGLVTPPYIRITVLILQFE